MDATPQTLVIRTLAKGATAEIRSLIEICEDRETGRVLYTELRNLAHKLAEKHQFPSDYRCPEKKAA